MLMTLIHSLAFVTALAAGPKVDVSVYASERLLQAFRDAEADLEVRRYELELLGSAPLFGAPRLGIDSTCPTPVAFTDQPSAGVHPTR